MQRNVWLVVWVDCLLSASVAIGKPTPPTTTWFLTTLYLIFLLKNGKVALIQCLKISNHVPLCWLIWALMTFLIQKTLQVWEILLNYFFDNTHSPLFSYLTCKRIQANQISGFFFFTILPTLNFSLLFS